MFHCECHYKCDVCGRVLSVTDLRFELSISPCGEMAEIDFEDDRDYLDEIDTRLLCARDFSDDLDGDQDEIRTHDLCAECRRNFSIESLGRRAAPSLGFSPN